MKKITLLLAGVLTAGVSWAGAGYETPKGATGIAVVRNDESSFKLYYKSEEKADVKVQIFDADDKVIFSEVIPKSDGFARPYNFVNLREGDYTIRVDNGANWMSETVSYHADVDPNPFHIVKVDQERYLLTRAGNKEEVISVRILDENGAVLYEGSQKVEGAFAQLYNLGRRQGVISFEVSGKHGTRMLNK